MARTIATITADIVAARNAEDWGAVERLRDERRAAEVDADEAALRTIVWTVVEYPEGEAPIAWTTGYADLQSALSAVEAAHRRLWDDCAMGDDCPELVASTSGDRAKIGIHPDAGLDWASWTVTQTTIA